MGCVTQYSVIYTPIGLYCCSDLGNGVFLPYKDCLQNRCIAKAYRIVFELSTNPVASISYMVCHTTP